MDPLTSMQCHNRAIQVTELLLAIEQDEIDILHNLLRDRVVQADQLIQSHALCYAVRQKRTSSVELLLHTGADPLSKHNCRTPLYWSVIQDDCQMLDLLLKDVVDLLAKKFTGLFTAQISAGKNVGFRSSEERRRSRAVRVVNEALFYAAAAASINCVRLLLNIGADPNTYHYHDDEFLSWCTPMIAATFAGSSQMNKNKETIDQVVALLLENGADASSANYLGDSALHWAVTGGLFCSVRLLLRHGCDVNMGNKMKKTPLISLAAGDNCSDWNMVEMAELLLRWGADLHMIDSDLWNVLFYAVSQEYYELAEFLLQAGAKPDIILSECTGSVLYKDGHHEVNGRRDAGVSALFIATLVGNLSLVKLLIKWNAQVSPTFHAPLHNSNILIQAANDDQFDILSVLVESGTSSRSLLEARTYLIDRCHDISKDKMDVVMALIEQAEQPYTLKHICRGVVRNVTWACTGSRGLAGLPLPQQIISYLDFNNL